MIRIGLDVGSTTIKCVVVDKDNKILFSDYQRHFAQIAEKIKEFFSVITEKFSNEKEISIRISGSAGMGLANELGIPFVQEVYATRLAVKTLLPETDTVIELGGEDAKILFVSNTMEVRMNGTCAGGTGAFIDQMSTLLKATPTEMNELAKDCQKMYTIASRCGVFAKSDIQPLLNQGARKEDISASVFAAVVNQTIGGLSQGRKIEGNVVYLGGPLTFFSELRNEFDKALELKGTLPEDSLYYVSYGTAIALEDKTFNVEELRNSLNNYKASGEYQSCPALFNNEEEYNEFAQRHKIEEGIELSPLKGKAYIGIDAGSTTLKGVVIGEDEKIAHYKYISNGGNPVSLVKEFLTEVYEKFPDIVIGGFGTTGYGETIIKNAFQADRGIVETLAHFTAAKKYNKNVDFIIDIGGQDIKCFKIRNGAIDNIFLNEACSSGCGSFLQTFAAALGEDIEVFSKKGLFAKRPVELGSRCTVFMNSSVKQAQKDGASIDNISAGLSISVVKNALYKVVRITNPSEVGENIVVQGGTFLNNAVLRAFEMEMNLKVTRPNIAGLMGAFGAALYTKENPKRELSKILTKEQLENFKHDVKAVNCGLCTNKCKLTVNTFEGGRKFIGGNRCERPLKNGKSDESYNMFNVKRELLAEYSDYAGTRETIGVPMVLNMYEMLPFWHKFFKELGFGLKITQESTRDTFLRGQTSIPSDTVCYPAKLVHGHIEDLKNMDIDAIFYPCQSYNFKEKVSDNCYNCPVVAYYPEVIEANVDLNKLIIKDHLGVHKEKYFPQKIHEILSKYFKDLNVKQITKASKLAFAEYETFMAKIRNKGKEFLAIAKEKNMPIIVLAGRPYHLDGEVNHGVDQLICDSGAVLITEDAISDLNKRKLNIEILNQWTYHSRLYEAAQYIADSNDNKINLVQLVSFGCGIDAVTTDAVRSILEAEGKIYTQLKIDEITNLGAIKIRLRSLFAATGMENN
ncbi:MAG: acyl-CoA dehydratase activase [bacterium]